MSGSHIKLLSGIRVVCAPWSVLADPVAGYSRAIVSIVLTTVAAIFIVVFSLLAYSVVKFRDRHDDERREPPQIYGSNQVELAGR